VNKPNPKLAYVTIPAASIKAEVETYVKLPFRADFVIAPPFVPSPLAGGPGLTQVTNGDDFLGYFVRVNDASAPLLPFGASLPGNQGLSQISVIEGGIDAIYISRIVGAASIAPLVLLVGTDCDFGFVGGVTGTS